MVIYSTDFEENKMEKELTRFEKTRIISARALQLAMGAPPLLKEPERFTKPLDLAMEEFENKLIPITVIREE